MASALNLEEKRALHDPLGNCDLYPRTRRVTVAVRALFTLWREFPLRVCGLLGLLALAVSSGLLTPSTWAATGALDAAPAAISPLDSALSGTINPDKSGSAALAGNPLWAVPLSVLSMTRERPLFSPSRRPIAPAVAAAPIAGHAPPPRPTEPDHPPLTLVGTIVGQAGSIAIFADQVSKNFIRLKTGQDHAGWTLRSIFGREATFEREDREVTLGLPARSERSETTAATPAAHFPASKDWAPQPRPQAATSRDGDGQLISPPPNVSGH
jgi:general secretion pathway protein N